MIAITERTRIRAPIERCFNLARSIDLHVQSAGSSREEAIAGRTTGLIGPEEWVGWRGTHFGVRQRFTSRITAFDYPTFLRDEMVRGAFRSFSHDHRFQPLSAAETEMTDSLAFAAPFPVLGGLAEKLVLRAHMQHFLRRRNAVLRATAESGGWRLYRPELGAEPSP